MRDRVILADAALVTPQQFFRALNPAPNPEAQAERAQALSAYRDAVQAVYRSDGTLWDHIERKAVLDAVLKARLREIEAQYALAPVHRDNDPATGNDRVAA